MFIGGDFNVAPDSELDCSELVTTRLKEIPPKILVIYALISI